MAIKLAKKYSKVIKVEDRKYRYNNEECVIEWVGEDGEVVDSVGLMKESAEDDLQGYVEGWHYELQEEFRQSFSFMF